MDVEAVLKGWGESLCKELPIGGLLARNEVAHKWKAPFRSMSLRETLLWRVHDLLTQSLLLHQQHHALGARILLRSAFEALATLIYLNLLTQQVLAGVEDFHEYGNKTSRLLLGSKNKSTELENINIMTVLKHCEMRYPGIGDLYASLSESAHPSYEGMCRGYSWIDYNNYVTHYENRWQQMYGDKHMERMALCLSVFEYEYNEVWDELFTRLEKWIEANDTQLEASKSVQEQS